MGVKEEEQREVQRKGEDQGERGKGRGVVERTPVLQTQTVSLPKYSGKEGAHTHQTQSEIGGAQGHS